VILLRIMLAILRTELEEGNFDMLHLRRGKRKSLTVEVVIRKTGSCRRALVDGKR
jgi:hypothetical protein